MGKGIDCDFRLSAHQANELKNAGYTWVGRYINWQTKPENCLILEEAQMLRDCGLYVVSLWENGYPTSAEYFTKEQGIIDGGNARIRAKDLLQPPNASIYFCVDYDASQADLAVHIDPYFQAVNEELLMSVNAELPTYEPDCYGSGLVLTHLYNRHLIKRGWKAFPSGWAGYDLFEPPAIRQTSNGTPMFGTEVDTDESNGDAGGWLPE